MPNRRTLSFPNGGLTRNSGNNEVNLPPRNVIGCPSRQIKERHPVCNQVRKEQHMELCHVEKDNELPKSWRRMDRVLYKRLLCYDLRLMDRACIVLAKSQVVMVTSIAMIGDDKYSCDV